MLNPMVSSIFVHFNVAFIVFVVPSMVPFQKVAGESPKKLPFAQSVSGKSAGALWCFGAVSSVRVFHPLFFNTPMSTLPYQYKRLPPPLPVPFMPVAKRNNGGATWRLAGRAASMGVPPTRGGGILCLIAQSLRLC